MRETSPQGSFCFRCPNSGIGFPDDEAPAVNPWPYLVAPQEFSRVTASQPLVYAVYSPQPIPAMMKRLVEAPPEYQSSTDAMKVIFIIWHEMMHMDLMGRTPAKQLAKTHLDLCYHAIERFMRGRGTVAPDIRILEAFWDATEALAEIANKIVLVEELLATAVAIRALDNFSRPGGLFEGKTEMVREIEQLALQEEEQALPGFERLYRQTGRMLDFLMNSQDFRMLVLQPIVENAGQFEAADASLHLAELLTAVNKARSPDAVVKDYGPQSDEQRRLFEIIRSDGVKHRTVFVTDSGQRLNAGFFASGLDKLRGTELTFAASEHEELETEVTKDLLRGMSMFGAPMMLVWPTRNGNETVLNCDWWHRADQDTMVYGGHHVIMLFEAIRQQLLAGSGFSCPSNLKNGQPCRCHPEVRRGLFRLADLARDGLFGAGEWHSPTCT